MAIPLRVKFTDVSAAPYVIQPATVFENHRKTVFLGKQWTKLKTEARKCSFINHWLLMDDACEGAVSRVFISVWCVVIKVAR